MRFKLSSTSFDQYSWHDYFVWFPHVIHDHVVWLETITRKRHTYENIFDHVKWDYKPFAEKSELSFQKLCNRYYIGTILLLVIIAGVLAFLGFNEPNPVKLFVSFFLFLLAIAYMFKGVFFRKC